MYIADKITERLHFLKAMLARNPDLEGVEVSDFLRAAFRSAFVKKLTMGGKITPAIKAVGSGIREVYIAGRKVYWPESAGMDELAHTYWEVYFDRHEHMFDTHGTELRKDDVVLDCGACEGFFTMKALERGASKVYAFEPGSVMADCLERLFAEEIRDGRVAVVPKLLGDATGTCLFDEDPSHPGLGEIVSAGHAGGSYARSVEVATIDGFVASQGLDRLDYIKADVEGGEVALIEGARETITRFRPRMAIAVYHYPGHAKAVADLVRSIHPGYIIRPKGLKCSSGVVRPMILHCHV